MSLVDYKLCGTICVLRLHAPPVNAITLALLEEMRNALRRANTDSQVRGIVITGEASHFSAGADVRLFREIASAEDAVRFSRIFQEAFQEVEDSSKPVAAAVAGNVQGGALELAMACHRRVCARESRFRMPEVTLGINPGAGGTQRLPRLMGAGRALKMLLTGSAIRADDALAAGLMDVVCEGRDLVEEAARLLESPESRPKTSERVDKIQDSEANAAAFTQTEKLLARVRPEIIAPSRIADAVKTGLTDSFQAGLRKEQEGFAACMATLATQNKIYLFFAGRESAKAPALVDLRPATITKVGVVGMGSMGAGIALALLLADVPVVALDQNNAIIQKGLDRIHRSIEKRVTQRRCSPERADRMRRLIRTTTSWADLADTDLVIEAVFEDVPTKRAVIAAIEKACRADAIIASNTSTISLDDLAEGMQHPERLVGLHFFNPAHRMPLVEVIQRDEAAPQVVATAMRFARTMRKTPVLVQNCEGWVVNRVFVPYVKEAFWLLEEGADAQTIDRVMIEFGFPMGPFVLMDMAGLDILALTDRVMSRKFPRHGPLSPIAVKLVEGGHLGQKTGSGVYRYEPEDRHPHNSDVTRQIIESVRADKGITPRDIGQDEISERLVLRMVTEAFRVIEEGVVQRESDVDAATLLGMGFPDFRGGVLKYARDLGLDTVRARAEELARRFGERFSPCELLQNLKGKQ